MEKMSRKPKDKIYSGAAELADGIVDWLHTLPEFKRDNRIKSANKRKLQQKWMGCLVGGKREMRLDLFFRLLRYYQIPSDPTERSVLLQEPLDVLEYFTKGKDGFFYGPNNEQVTLNLKMPRVVKVQLNLSTNRAGVIREFQSIIRGLCHDFDLKKKINFQITINGSREKTGLIVNEDLHRKNPFLELEKGINALYKKYKIKSDRKRMSLNSSSFIKSYKCQQLRRLKWPVKQITEYLYDVSEEKDASFSNKEREVKKYLKKSLPI